MKSRQDIIDFAIGFLGTKFKAGCAIKGVGCDCAGLIEAILREQNAEIPPRNLNLPSAINQALDVCDIPKAGDVILFKSLRNDDDYHAGIFINLGNFIHAHWSRGVVINTYGKWFKARTIGIYSFKGIA